MNEVVTADIYDDAMAAAGDKVPEPTHSKSESATLTLTSLGQLAAIKKSLGEHEVTWGDLQPELDDVGLVERAAKAKAVENARENAQVYATALGLRPVRVVKISEAGNGMFMPGTQRMFEKMMSGGPAAMAQMMRKNSSGTVHVEVSILVEFVLAP
jgi:uncharacterized protein YggE